jgi:hypothetical protein
MCLPCHCIATAVAQTTENTVPLLMYHCCVHVCYCENVSSEPLPRNGPGISIHLVVIAWQLVYMLHCSLLKAIRPEWPTGIPQFFLFRGLCLWHLCLVSSSSLWFGFHGVYSPTTRAAPSLRPLIPSSFLIKCRELSPKASVQCRGPVRKDSHWCSRALPKERPKKLISPDRYGLFYQWRKC